jgi:hypothetical protein
MDLRRGILAFIVVAALATGAASGQQVASRYIEPKACRASGLWVLDRHTSETQGDRWETLAMAPWSTWAAGFALADGRGGSLALRVSYTTGDRIDLTGEQAGVEQDPTVFMRSTTSGCAFYTTTDAVVYRFRRER